MYHIKKKFLIRKILNANDSIHTQINTKGSNLTFYTIFDTEELENEHYEP